MATRRSGFIGLGKISTQMLGDPMFITWCGAGGPDYTLADEKTGILPWSEDLEKKVRRRIPPAREIYRAAEGVARQSPPGTRHH